MLERRSLLTALLSLGGLAALVSACKHRSPYQQKENSGVGDDEDRGDGGGGGGGGGGGY